MNKFEALVIITAIVAGTIFGIVCVEAGIDGTVIKSLFALLGAALGLGGGYVISKRKK